MQESAVAALPIDVRPAGQLAVGVQKLIVYRGAVSGRDRLQIHAGNGLIGYGEGDWAEEILRTAPELLIGHSPFEVESIFEELTHRTGRTPGGLDMALWDISARTLGMPLCRLLGKTYRQEVRVCAPSAEKVLDVDGVELIEEPFPAANLEAYRGLRGKAGARIVVPEGPGLAVDVVPEAVEEFRTELIEIV